MKIRIRRIAFLSLFLSLAVGCSSNPNSAAQVNGDITYKGQKVTAGSITFFDKDNVAHTYLIRPDGTYGGSDLPAGEMQVVIETESAKAKRKADSYGGKQGSKAISPAPKGSKVVAQGEYVPIPKKYGDKSTSQLTATLNAGSNRKDFELSD